MTQLGWTLKEYFKVALPVNYFTFNIDDAFYIDHLSYFCKFQMFL